MPSRLARSFCCSSPCSASPTATASTTTASTPTSATTTTAAAERPTAPLSVLAIVVLLPASTAVLAASEPVLLVARIAREAALGPTGPFRLVRLALLVGVGRGTRGEGVLERDFEVFVAERRVALSLWGGTDAKESVSKFRGQTEMMEGRKGGLAHSS